MPELRFPHRAALEAHQLDLLNELLGRLVPANEFWTPRLRAAGLAGGVSSLHEFRERLPLTDKSELAADQRAHPPYGTNRTFPLERYVRVHQTSSTTGAPLRWLDTREDWEWLCSGWREVWRAVGLEPRDRLFTAFSFGPFVGFWLGWEAAQQIGALCIPGGGLDSKTRLRVMQANAVTVLGCTPTYAIRLGEVARREGIAPSALPVRAILVGGEPGGCLGHVRQRIEELWPGARIHDHHGMTEVGPVSYQTADDPDVLHVLESEFLVEVVDPESGAPTTGPEERGELGELVITSLGRVGSPALRYRTRDLVQPDGCGPPPRPFLRLRGGIRARSDQMVVVRGVNVFPSGVDEIVRGVEGVAEYRVEVDRSMALIELRVVVEPATDVRSPGELCGRVADAFRAAWSLRIPVAAAAPGELPRFELKAKRWVETT